MKSDEDKLDLIYEAIVSYKNGELKPLSTLITINSIINQTIISKKDIEWAKKCVRRYKNEICR